MPDQPLETNVNIDVRTLKTTRCTNCGGILFSHTHIIKTLPALLSNTGKDELVMFPLLVCDSCGELDEPSKQKAAYLTQAEAEAEQDKQEQNSSIILEK